jgi:hypothetical protein
MATDPREHLTHHVPDVNEPNVVRA